MPPSEKSFEDRALALEEGKLRLALAETENARRSLEIQRMQAQAGLRQSLELLSDEERAVEVELRRMELQRQVLEGKSALAADLAASPFVGQTIPEAQRVAFAMGLVEMAPLLGVPVWSLAQHAYIVHGRLGVEVDYLQALVCSKVEQRPGFPRHEYGPTKDAGAGVQLPEWVRVTFHAVDEEQPRSEEFTLAQLLASNWAYERAGEGARQLKSTYRGEGGWQMMRRAIARLIHRTPRLNSCVLGLQTVFSDDDGAAADPVVDPSQAIEAPSPHKGRRAPPRPALPAPDAEADLSAALAEQRRKDAAMELIRLQEMATPEDVTAARAVVGVGPTASLTPEQTEQLAAELRLRRERAAATAKAPAPAPDPAPVKPQNGRAAQSLPPAKRERPAFPVVTEVAALEAKVPEEAVALARHELKLPASTGLAAMSPPQLLKYAQKLEQQLPPDERIWGTA